MENVLIELIQSQGIWTVLFVFLLLYTIKRNDKVDEAQEVRETNYQKLLLELSEKLSVINSVNEKLDKIYSEWIKE